MAVAHIASTGSLHKTPAGSDGATHTHSIAGSIPSKLISGALSNSPSNPVLIIAKASQHIGTPSILAVFYDGTSLVWKKAYPRTEVLTASDMDDEQAAYKLNSQHLSFQYTGNPMTRTGSLHVANPTSKKFYDYINSAMQTFATTPSATNLNAVVTAVQSSPICKSYPLNERMTVEITCPSQQNWSSNGDENMLADSKFSQMDTALTEPGNWLACPPLNTDFTFNGTEIIMVFDGFGSTSTTSNQVASFVVNQHIGVEQYSGKRMSLMTPALAKSPAAAAALHAISGAIHSHNLDMTDSTPPLHHVQSHPSTASVLGSVAKFAYKNRKTEEAIGIGALSLL
jgi:hypothetical protein